MGIIEIIAAILLILACVFITVIVLMQESKSGMSQTITGASADNFYQKNSGRTREAALARGTKAAAITFFVVAILVNVVAIYFKGDAATSETPATTTAAVTTAADTTVAETTAATTAAEGEVTVADTTVADTTTTVAA